MKRLPIGIQNIREINEDNYVYIDKTQYIYRLLKNAKYYFLSRPRRFGKSLLLDTIAEVLGGNKELFNGLWIYNSDYKFIKHPVVRLDMNIIPNKNPETFYNALLYEMRSQVEKEELDIDCSEPAVLFKELVKSLHNKYNQKVAVLIDEYDKPITDHIDDIAIAVENRNILRDFYGTLESMEPYLRFTFITGIINLSKTSIFSELYNLKDITMSEEYAGICGIPSDSLDDYFGERITELAKNKIYKNYDDLKETILAWYNGYSWDGQTKLLNPFAILNFFFDTRIGSYWYTSGSPKLLIEMIKKKPESILSLVNMKITEPLLNTFEIERIEIEPLLFQTGYLTISLVEKSGDHPKYVLNIPNNEIRDALSADLVAHLTDNGNVYVGQAQIKIGRALEAGDLQTMLEILRELFASIPHDLHVNEEEYYRSIFYTVMLMLGFDIDAEVPTSQDQVNGIFELDDMIYIMGFKYVKYSLGTNDVEKEKIFDSTLTAAIDQINNRGYSDRFKGSGKTIYKAAFAFLGRDEIEMRID